MGVYGKIERSIWNSPKFKLLSDDSKLLFVYLLTCKHGNMIGCFELPSEYAASDMKWAVGRVSKGYSELYQNGFITVCEEYSMVLINNFLKHNQLENPNTVKAAIKLFNQIPDKSIIKCLLARAIIDFCPHANTPKTISILEPYRNGIETVCDTLSKPVPVTVTETVNSNREQLTVTGNIANALVEQARPVSKKNAKESPICDEMQDGEFLDANDPVLQVFEYWQEIMKTKRALSTKRKRRIVNALKNYSVEQLKQAIRGCAKSPHHMGQNNDGTIYDDIELICREPEKIDFFIAKETVIVKTKQEIAREKIMNMDLENMPSLW